MGAQECRSDASGFTACVCTGTGSDGGVSMTPDAGGASCGDGICNGIETCTSCARDCGACMTAPRCGDGMCNGAETCSSCTDDCGRCPPRCGDLVCDPSESCSSCVGDCGQCQTMCMGCARDTDCPATQFCGRRRCDGVAGCYSNDPTATCALIGGIACPPTAAYNTCITAAECGPYADCHRFTEGDAFCARRCTADTDCPSAPPGSTGIAPRCDTRSQICYLTCTGPGVCPFGLRCTRFSNGTFGYCS